MAPIGYFSAEIGLDPGLPTYSGGLGILAGDHLKAAADMGLEAVGVTLLYRQGQALQRLEQDGLQRERWTDFHPEAVLEELDHRVEVPLDGTTLHARVWRYRVRGRNGHEVPVLLLDSHCEENPPELRELGWRLYGGDRGVRLRQEYLLGSGGVEALEQLGYWPLSGVHLNEGHTAFAMLALLKRGWSREKLKARSLFTSHTTIPAGHDHFDYPDVQEVAGAVLPLDIRELAGAEQLSMSHLAAALTGRCNGVSKINARVAAGLFPGVRVEPVTNGVHHTTWTGWPMARLYDAHLTGWQEQPGLLARAAKLPLEPLVEARTKAKKRLLDYVNAATYAGMATGTLTVGFARRMVPYKRPQLLFEDRERLIEVCRGRVQFVFAGSAHPTNVPGKAFIRRIHSEAKDLAGKVRVVFLENYSMWLSARMVAGCDVWLNNPVRPMEACGTSGMKAALNGGVNLSVLDGWWAEACRHKENGWAIGAGEEERDDLRDAACLFDLLEREVLPAWEAGPEVWAKLMRNSIATSADYTAERMVGEYTQRYYNRFGP